MPPRSKDRLLAQLTESFEKGAAIDRALTRDEVLFSAAAECGEGLTELMEGRSDLAALWARARSERTGSVFWSEVAALLEIEAGLEPSTVSSARADDDDTPF